MSRNPYQPPPETPREKRLFRPAKWIVAVSMLVAFMLVIFDAPRWMLAGAGVCAALAADRIVTEILKLR